MIELLDEVTDKFPPAPLAYHYDEGLDVMTVEGIKYSGHFFRVLALTGPSDQAFRIVGRDEDGVLTIKKVEATV